MNSPACALGIDAGTTAVRVVAICASGAIWGRSQAVVEAPPGERVARQDPAAWWQATQAALFAIGRQVDLRQIRALSVDGTSGSVLGVDKGGVPMTLGRMYNDIALPTTIEALAGILPEDSAARGATSPLARMIELQRPGIYKLLHQADWLSGQFSGRFDISDENNALKSGFDVRARAWPAWMAKIPLELRLLPQVVPTGTDLGSIRTGVAAQFGFNPDLRVVSGTTDGCASFLACGAYELGDAVTSLGTTLTLKQICERPIANATLGIYSHRLGDRWLSGGASNSGGGALLKFFSRQQLVDLEPRLTPDQDTGLNYYPLADVGERFPYADPDLKSVVEPRPHDEARFLQGLLEGIARIEKTGYGRLKEFGAPALRRVVTVGGGSHNEAWRQIRERVLGVPVTQGVADAAYGAALIALSRLNEKSLFQHAREG